MADLALIPALRVFALVLDVRDALPILGARVELAVWHLRRRVCRG